MPISASLHNERQESVAVAKPKKPMHVDPPLPDIPPAVMVAGIAVAAVAKNPDTTRRGLVNFFGLGS